MTCLPCSSAIFILASSAARRVGGGEQRDAGLQVTCFVREELDHRLRSQRQVSVHETCGRDGGQCERTHFVTTRGGQHVQQLRHSLCRAQVCRRLPVCCSCVTRVIAQHVRQGIHKALQVRVQQLRLLLVLGQLQWEEREHTSASALVFPVSLAHGCTHDGHDSSICPRVWRALRVAYALHKAVQLVGLSDEGRAALRLIVLCRLHLRSIHVHLLTLRSLHPRPGWRNSMTRWTSVKRGTLQRAI